jgi:hypothetical protein
MPFYADLLRLFGFSNTQQIEFYQNRAKLHTAVHRDEKRLTLMAQDLAECYEGRNENSKFCSGLRQAYDAFYEKHYG